VDFNDDLTGDRGQVVADEIASLDDLTETSRKRKLSPPHQRPHPPCQKGQRWSCGK
jgi:hypothetical protein